MLVSSFDEKDFVIDLYYYFNKSTKRKNSLSPFCSSCNQDYRSIVKHGSTHWLNLHMAIERVLSNALVSDLTFSLQMNHRQDSTG